MNSSADTQPSVAPAATEFLRGALFAPSVPLVFAVCHRLERGGVVFCELCGRYLFVDELSDFFRAILFIF